MQRSRLFFILSWLVVSASAAYADSIKLIQPASTMLAKTYHYKNFNRIVADGYFNLTIVAPKTAAGTVNTLSYDQMAITAVVHEHTLYLTSSPHRLLNYPQHPAVTVQVANLSQLDVYGPTNVVMQDVPSAGYALRAEGYGEVRIRNAGQLRSLQQHSNSVVNISGIHSSALDLTLSGAGVTTLQGKVDQLYARLNHDAILKARDLAAKQVTIQAHYHSYAYIYPLQTLRAFADQSGEIFYYKHLTDLTRFPIESGNVFQMQW